MPTAPLRDLFERVVQLPRAEQAAWLAANCDDAELRAQVQRLVDADEAPDASLDEGVVSAMIRQFGEPSPESLRLPPGSRIGTFEIVSLLGEGGSSTVYRAVRHSAGLVQTVALKVLHRSLLSPDARRQFDRERRALGQLQHANVARLIEGGVTDGGVAFLALDLVEGRTILEHARAKRLSLGARIALVIATCRAVEAAHRALIVHRDLKPSNVLVTDAGDVKLVDFGIAKWLHTTGDDDTRTQHRAFTPAYSAPEQRDGGIVTTSTDVYALGVILGELVVGRRLADEAKPPSSRIVAAADGVLPLPPRELRAAVRGDLDNILMKAVAHAPARRYASAGALADDLQRWRDGHAVLAHPPSTLYFARKFVGRHRVAVIATATLAAALVVAVSAALWQGVVARREAANARGELARANAMSAFFFDAFAGAEPATPRDGPLTVRELVGSMSTAAALREVDDPRANVDLRLRLARVLNAQGDIDAAGAMLRDAREVARTARLDRGRTAQVDLAIADNLVDRGDLAAARGELDALLARATLEPRVRVEALGLSGVLETRRGDRDRRAERDARAAVTLARADGDVDLQRAALNALGVVLLANDRADEAVPLYEELVALNRSLRGSRHRGVATALAGLSRAYRRTGQLERATAVAEEAIAIDRVVHDGDHWRMIPHLNALVVALRDRGEYARALAPAHDAWRIGRAKLGNDHPETVNAQYLYGAVLALLERYDEARAPLADALARSATLFGDAAFDTAVVRATHGFVLAMAGDADGDAAMARAIDDLSALPRPNVDMIALALERRALAARHAGRIDVAVAALDRLASWLPKRDAAADRWRGVADGARAALALDAGDAATALAHLERHAAADLDAARVDVALAERAALRALAAAALRRDDAPSLAAVARARIDALAFVPARVAALRRRLSP